MSFTDAIGSLTIDQLRDIIRLRREVPLVQFLAANGRARQACALRHKGWMDHSTIFVNAMLRKIRSVELNDSYATATLLSAVESYAIGLLAKDDLNLDEYNLLIGCVAKVATPEIILTEQNWTPEPLPTNEAVTRKNYETLKTRDESRGKRHTQKEDPDEELAESGIDTSKALAALLKPKPKPETVKVDTKSAIDRMLGALKKKDPERVRIEKGSAGKYQLVGIETGTVYGEVFERPADAIVYATRNKLKLGVAE
jgi:hypothetical protein